MTEGYIPPSTSAPRDIGAGATLPIGTEYSAPNAADGINADNGSADSGGGAVDVAKDQVSAVTQAAVEAGQRVTDIGKEQAANVTAEAGRQAKDLLAQTQTELTQQASQQQQRLAEGLRTLGDELYSMAHHSEQPGVAADLARHGADKTREVASWLDAREPGTLVDEVKTFARQRPGTFLLLAVGAGLLAGRLTRGLRDTASNDSASGSTFGADGPSGLPNTGSTL
jgi:hypothetical protein